MSHSIMALDGTGDTTTPFSIEGWAPTAESGNVVSELIAPGSIAVTLVGDLPRTGSLRLVYADDEEAEAARLLFGRPCAFALSSAVRGVVDMTFVRARSMTPAMHDQVHSLWKFDVGFQETP